MGEFRRVVMRTLYIIGNGFDLHFKLKTKTNHFVEHLKTQPVYNEVGNAFEVLNCYGVDWYEYEPVSYKHLDVYKRQIIYWWSTALDYNFGNGSIKKEQITWPGSIENAKEVIESLHEKWVSKLSELSDGELLMKHNAKWPLDERNFADTALWLNAELMKNAAEIGYARFLYGNSMKQK